MKAPHYFIHGNVVFGSGPDDPWAAYRLEGDSYPGLSLGRKIELKERIEAFAYEIETDFQLIRVSRQWSVDAYVERAMGTLAPRTGHEEAFRRYLEGHRRGLGGRQIVRPETFLLVRLAGPATGAQLGRRLGEIYRQLNRNVGVADARGLSNRRIAEIRRAEERCWDRVYSYLPCERALSGEISSLIRGSYGRGVAALGVDPNWKPQALWLEPSEDDLDGDGEEVVPRFEPYEHDLMRLHESRVEVAGRGLELHTEAGVSYQAMLVVGALPDRAVFPSPDIELLFTPLEAGFPVDVVFTAEFVDNKRAQKLAQKRMVDADQAAIEESYGTHGPSVKSQDKMGDARELQGRLGGSDRPPLLRSAITLCIGAQSEEELEERIERMRGEFGRIELHRPLGEQHRLFVGTMPAQRFPVADYKAHLLPEQFGAMVPTAISHAGSEIGPYLGYTLTGSRQPVQFDLAEACRSSRPPTVLLTGSLGSGKALDVSTLIPGPDGWKTMGELAAGDRVFDERGEPCSVTDTFDQPPGRECYEVHFCDGSAIVADAEHRWRVREPLPRGSELRRARAKSRQRVTAGAGEGLEGASVGQVLERRRGGGVRRPRAVIRTTKQIAESMRSASRRHSIEVTEPVRYERAELPQDPYEVGARLGEALDADVGRIPRRYLEADEDQRRELLAGLLDAAGGVGSDGSVQFSCSSKTLASNFCELVVSLGYRAIESAGGTRSARRRVSFFTADVVFGLRAPQEKLTKLSEGHDLGAARQREIVEVLAVPSRSVRCISVDSPSHLYLAGESMIPTHNTMTLETLLYQAYLQGSSPIVDIDPKGDHELQRFAALEGAVEEIELGPDELYRGLLDPMRIGTDAQRADLTNNFLTTVLPDIASGWRTEIRQAISVADAEGARTVCEVLDELEKGNEDAVAAARALRVHLDAGLAKLGYARPGLEIPELGGRQVVSMRIRNLNLPKAGLPRSDYQDDERVSAAILRLLASYALRLCAAETTTHSVLALDEAWALLSDSQGKAVIDQFSRMGRSMNITPLLASQILGDAEELQPLVGAYLAFGVETEAEAEAALALLRLDSDDTELQEQLMRFRKGRCYLRDFDGRAVPMRVDPGEELLTALDTTPRREVDPAAEEPSADVVEV